MSLSTVDYQFLSLALDLAYKGIHTTKPNPCVGCVIVKNNKIIGKGYHERSGFEHAEIKALQDCNYDAKDATCYVTLEPCFHFGRTPPCVDALIKAKVKRVVIINLDHNKLTRSKSCEKLQSHNIQLDVVEGILENIKQDDSEYAKLKKLIDIAYELNKGFFKRMQINKPWVISKIAISMDGKIALKDGYSKWITSDKSRLDVHNLRSKMSAIITTSKTVIKDNAKLNPRGDYKLDSKDWPLRVVLDKNLNTVITNNIYNIPGKVIIFADINNLTKENNIKLSQFLDKNIKVYDYLDLENLILFLADKFQCNIVLFEAGSILNSELLNKKLVDELIIYKSNKILGQDSISMFNIEDISKEQMSMDFSNSLVNNLNYFKLHSVEAIENDVKLVYRS